MRLLFDTNIILDIALKREPHYKDSAEVLKKADNKNVFGFITTTTITDIYYIAKKDKGHILALEFVKNLIEILELIVIDKEIIYESTLADFNDFEDAIQSVSASHYQIDYILTRNTKDFINSKVKAITPIEFNSLD